MLCVKLAKAHKSAISLPWSFQPTSDPFVNSWFITGSYFLCQIYKLYCAWFDIISTLYTTQWDSKFIGYKLLPWKMTSMQSGFHLESMGNKFIGFFFCGWCYLWGHEWLYNRWNWEEKHQSDSGSVRRGQQRRIIFTQQQCIRWYSAVSLLSASHVLSCLSLLSTPVRCPISSQVRLFCFYWSGA